MQRSRRRWPMPYLVEAVPVQGCLEHLRVALFPEHETCGAHVACSIDTLASKLFVDLNQHPFHSAERRASAFENVVLDSVYVQLNVVRLADLQRGARFIHRQADRA